MLHPCTGRAYFSCCIRAPGGPRRRTGGFSRPQGRTALEGARQSPGQSYEYRTGGLGRSTLRVGVAARLATNGLPIIRSIRRAVAWSGFATYKRTRPSPRVAPFPNVLLANNRVAPDTKHHKGSAHQSHEATRLFSRLDQVLRRFGLQLGIIRCVSTGVRASLPLAPSRLHSGGR